MHKQSLHLLKKSHSAIVTDYAPMATARTTLDPRLEAKLRRWFDIAYFLAKYNFAFKKLVPMCLLEERHGVELGTDYRNEKAAATFVAYIAQLYQEDLASTLGKRNFLAFKLMGALILEISKRMLSWHFILTVTQQIIRCIFGTN